MNTQTISSRAWIDLILLALVWGAIFLVIEFALEELTPLWSVFHRICWAACLLWVIVYGTGGRMPFAPGVWGAFIVMGALNNAIPFSLITWGQTSIESGLTSILNGATAFFGIIVAAAFLADERLTPARVLGVLIGMAGVTVIIGWRSLLEFDPRALGQIAVLGAGVSYAFAGVWARNYMKGLTPMQSATGMLTGSTLLMLPIAWAVEGAPDISLSFTSLAAIVYMSIFGTVIAYLLYYRILAAAGSGNLMLVTIMMPPISIFLGWLVLAERLAPSAFIGCGLIALGLIILDGRAWRAVAARRSEA